MYSGGRGEGGKDVEVVEGHHNLDILSKFIEIDSFAEPLFAFMMYESADK